MNKPTRNRSISITTFILFIMLASSPVGAVPWVHSPDQEFDVTPNQMTSLNKSPDIYFFPSNLEKFIKDKNSPLISLRLPSEPGGFLAGTKNNMEKGLYAVSSIKNTEKEKIAEQAAVKEATSKNAKPAIENEFLFTTGYRVDNLDWSIAGNNRFGNYVNVLSELTWDDIEIYQIKFKNRTILYEFFYLRGSIDYGWIFDGENQDSDFDGDDRTFEWSRSNNSANEGNVLDASIGIGLHFTFVSGNLSIAPLIGFSYHQQDLTISDGNQTIPPIGSFADLDSTYDAKWDGPWVGLDFTYRLNKKNAVFAEVEYHWADYTAEADWNLRSDFAHPKSFEHDTEGNGIIVSTGWKISFSKSWYMNLNFDYQNWSTDAGIDRTFFDSGLILETPLNEVNWESYAIMLGVGYHF